MGRSGLLGAELRHLLPEILASSHQEFDVLDSDGIHAFMINHPVDAVLHAAAFTSPPKVDQNPIMAMQSDPSRNGVFNASSGHFTAGQVADLIWSHMAEKHNYPEHRPYLTNISLMLLTTFLLPVIRAM